MAYHEEIKAQGQIVALVVSAEFPQNETTFLTSPQMPLQLGFIFYEANNHIPPHIHVPIRREITGTSEVIIVKRGRCEVDFYDEERNHLATKSLAAGDIVILFSGGHGFRMLEDTTLIEVKQGPYSGMDEKVRFPET